MIDQFLLLEGLAWIGVNIFNYLDGKSLKNCEFVCLLWRDFIINNPGLWKRQYLDQLASPGTNAHALIRSNLKLFQGNQGIFKNHATLQCNNHATLQHNNNATLQCNNHATFNAFITQSCNTTIMQPCNATITQPFEPFWQGRSYAHFLSDM
jgi:hypothetical protein